MKTARGLTLLEMLVVVALMATLAGIAAMVLGRALPGRELHAAAREVADELRFFFITSRLEFKPVVTKPQAEAGAWIHAVSTSHSKCVRCWHYRADVGQHADDPELCGRCVENVNGAGETRRWF